MKAFIEHGITRHKSLLDDNVYFKWASVFLGESGEFYEEVKSNVIQEVSFYQQQPEIVVNEEEELLKESLLGFSKSPMRPESKVMTMLKRQVAASLLLKLQSQEVLLDVNKTI